MPMQGGFDANQFVPTQFGGKHPVGNGFNFEIVSTAIEPTKDNDGGMFKVEFRTEAGTIFNRYNIWNKSEKAKEIAHGQLSALCHATGVFKLDWANDGAALKGARGKLDVGLQNAEDPNGYVEVKKVYDANGNEPGKAPAPANRTPAQQAATTAPATTQAGAGWNSPATSAPAADGPAWGAPAQGEAAPAADDRPAWAQS